MTIQRYTGYVSVTNSTTTALGPLGVFIGDWEDVSSFSAVFVTVFADKDSANDGLSFQWSNNGIDMIFEESTTVTANVGRGNPAVLRAKYFRVKYANGAQAQTSFSMQTICSENASGLISRPLDKALTGENFAQTVRSASNGLDISVTPSVYRPLICNPSGYLISTDLKAATSGVTMVASSEINVTLLAANVARLGASIYNDSNKNLYLKLGETASLSSFSVLIVAGGYYEVPFHYIGIIDGIWESSNGNARITEFS